MTKREKWLILAALLSVGAAASFAVAWRSQLVPYETAFGTVAEWVGAGATVAGFAAAVYTLRMTAADAKRLEADRRRAEAARIAVAWNPDAQYLGLCESSNGGKLEKRWRHTGTIKNASGSPVQETYIWLTRLQSLRVKDGRNSVIHCETLLPGGERQISYDFAWDDTEALVQLPDPDKSKFYLDDMVAFGFRDVHGQHWIHEDRNLRKVPSSEDFAVNA